MTRASLLFLVLLSVGCDREPALLRQARTSETGVALTLAFHQSVEAEKSAVLAITDEDSERFAAESRRAARTVDRLIPKLDELIVEDGLATEQERLAAFSAAWTKVATIDAKLLPLAVANTNLKAAHRSTHEAAAALDRFLTAVAAQGAETKDPVRIRQLAAAAVAALTIQTLHAPHIASPDAAEMTALEARIATLAAAVDEALGTGTGPRLDEARTAWREHRSLTTEILRLSRQNTNVLSFELSVHAKRDASVAAEAALQALVAAVQPGPRATR